MPESIVLMAKKKTCYSWFSSFLPLKGFFSLQEKKGFLDYGPIDYGVGVKCLKIICSGGSKPPVERLHFLLAVVLAFQFLLLGWLFVVVVAAVGLLLCSFRFGCGSGR